MTETDMQMKAKRAIPMHLKQKLMSLGKILLVMIGLVALFVGIVGTGNALQNIGQKWAGNAMMVAFGVAVYFYVRICNSRLNQLSPQDTGFGFTRFWPSAAAGLLLAGSIFVVSLLITAISCGAKVEFMGLHHGFYKPLLGLLVAFSIVGAWEEFFFRGFVFPTLLKHGFGFHGSAFVSSILFSVVHSFGFNSDSTSWWWYAGIVAIGYLLVILYAITGSIWSVMIYHLLWNLLARLSNDNSNDVGLFHISNYSAISKQIDNIQVAVLAATLLAFLLLIRDGPYAKRIERFSAHLCKIN